MGTEIPIANKELEYFTEDLGSNAEYNTLMYDVNSMYENNSEVLLIDADILSTLH
jgi:hypothetical protein